MAEQNSNSGSRGIECIDKKTYRTELFFGLVLICFSAIFGFIAVPQEMAKGSYMPLYFIALMVVIGLFLVISGIRKYRKHCMLGELLLFLDPVAPGLGAEFGAWCVLPSKNPSKVSTNVIEVVGSLSCVQRTTDSSLENSSTERKVLWSHETLMHMTQVSNGVKLSGIIEIPEDLEPSQGNSNTANGCVWEFKMAGDLSFLGVSKFLRVWAVPVARVASAPVSGITLPGDHLAKSRGYCDSLNSAAASKQISLHDNGQSIDVTSTAGRRIGTSIGVCLFALVLSLVGAFTLTQEWMGGYVILAIGILLFFVGVFSIGSKITLSLNKSERTLYRARSLFGWEYSKDNFEVHDANQLCITSLSELNRHAKQKEVYVVSFDDSQKKHTIIENVEGRGAAESLRRSLAAGVTW